MLYRKAKLKGNIVGETDFDKHVIKINKELAKKHRELGLTTYHETIHANHPQMLEKTVYKKEKKFKTLSKKQKAKFYGKV